MNASEDILAGAHPVPADLPIISRILRPVEYFSKGITAVAILGVLIFTLGQVADRYILKGSFNAYDQIARIALIWMTFIGAALAFRERLNIVVDVIDGYLPARVIVLKAIVLDGLSLILMIALIGYSIRLLEVGSYQTILGTPFTYWEVYVSLVIGSVLFSMFLIARLAAGIVAASSNTPGTQL